MNGRDRLHAHRPCAAQTSIERPDQHHAQGRPAANPLPADTKFFDIHGDPLSVAQRDLRHWQFAGHRFAIVSFSCHFPAILGVEKTYFKLRVALAVRTTLKTAMPVTGIFSSAR